MPWALVRRCTLAGKFALLSLLCVVAITVTLCATATFLLQRYLIHHDAEMVGGLASDVGAHVLPEFYWRQPGHPAVYAETFSELARSSRIVRLILYDRQGRVLWSDEPTLIGMRYENASLARALAGTIVAEVHRPGAEAHHRGLAGYGPLEEIYVPVRHAGREGISGVLEIYRDPPALLALLDRSLMLIWLLGGGGGLAFYLALYAIVRAASKRQRALETELIEHAVTLEQRVAERTAELSRKSGEIERLYEEMKGTKQYLESLVESSADAIVTIDSRGRVSFLSRGGQQVFGCRAEDVIGMQARKFWARGAADFRAFRASLKAKQRILSHETELRAPAGQLISVSLSAALVHEPGERPGTAVCVVRDVSELRQLQEQVARAERLAAAGLLAAGVAHEVGNPLGCISFLAGLLRRRTSDPEVRQGLDDISQHATDIGRIVGELSPLVRPVPVERRAASIAGILEDAVRVSHYSSAVRRSRITIVLPPGLPRVPAAEDRLLEAFSNLITNAAEAGGDLTITAVVGLGEVRINFTDSGHGMDAEELRSIFDPFYTTRDAHAHAGLGLFVAHEVVRQHGGRILVESRRGVGSTFTIVLPTSQVPEAAHR